MQTANHFREELGKCYCSTIIPEAYAKLQHGIYSCAECDNFKLYLASKPDSKKAKMNVEGDFVAVHAIWMLMMGIQQGLSLSIFPIQPKI